MSQEVLWIDGWLTLEPLDELEVSLEIAGTTQRRDAACFASPAGRGSAGRRRWVLLVPLGTGFETVSRVRSVTLTTAWGELLWLGGRDRFISPDLVNRLFSPEFPARLLAHLEPFLANVFDREEGDCQDATFERNLLALRRAWASSGEPAPRAEALRSAFHLEEALVCAGGVLYFSGWLRPEDDGAIDASVLLDTGERIPVLSGAVRERRPDVDSARNGHTHQDLPGFLKAIALPGGKTQGRPRLLCLRGRDGEITWSPLKTKKARAAELREGLVRRLASSFPSVPPGALELLETVSAAARREARVTASKLFGTRPPEPRASVVVTLLSRPDLLWHHFLHLHRSRLEWPLEVVLLAAAERPRWEELSAEIASLSDLYQLPVTLLRLERQAPWAVAADLSARHARGEVLVFCHEHTLGFAASALGTLVETLGRDPSIGIAAPRIAHFDGSLHSAGLRVEAKESGDGLALEPLSPGAEVDPPIASRIDACGSDCFAVRRDLFEELGGLSGLFVHRDFETIDLCLRAADSGWSVARAPAAFTRALLRGKPPCLSEPETAIEGYDLGMLTHRRARPVDRSAAAPRSTSAAASGPGSAGITAGRGEGRRQGAKR